ncbi:uncharacterized protein LOC121629265, partial [Scomber scombrus]
SAESQPDTPNTSHKVTGPATKANPGTQKAPDLCRLRELDSISCSLCGNHVSSEEYTQHLSDYHVQEQCEQCGVKVWGAVGLLQHIETVHLDQGSSTRGPFNTSNRCSTVCISGATCIAGTICTTSIAGTICTTSFTGTAKNCNHSAAS